MRLAVIWLIFGLAPGPPPFARRFVEIRDSAGKDELCRFLWALPKGGDLHNHHEYSVPPEEWLRLAERSQTNYLVRVRLTPCSPGPAGPPQFTTLRLDSVRALPACVQRDFEPLSAMTAADRAAWLSALRLDQPGGSQSFRSGLAAPVGAPHCSPSAH